MDPRTGGKKFRYVQVSDALSERDQNKTLWLVPAMRRIKVGRYSLSDIYSVVLHLVNFMSMTGTN
jgi:hypothetical protein